MFSLLVQTHKPSGCIAKPDAIILSTHSVAKITKNKFSTYSSNTLLTRFVSLFGNGVWAPNAIQLAHIVIKINHSNGVLN